MEQFKSSEDLDAALKKKFEELSGHALHRVTYEELPPSVREHLESESQKFIDEREYRERDFDTLFTFQHENGDISYIAERDKQYGANDAKERLTYFADTRDGELIGKLEIRYSLSELDDYFKQKPFVGMTKTYEGFLKQGLAKRRLEAGNAYAYAEYGNTLHSDTLIDEKAKRVWERLVEEGVAERFREGKHERFRFLPPHDTV